MSTTHQLRKVAALLLSLPRELAATLLVRLDVADVTAVAREIANSRPASDTEQKAAAAEFVAATVAMHPMTRRETSAPARVATFATTATSDGHRALHEHFATAFSFLRHLDAPLLVGLLVDEHPQTIALVAAGLPRSMATSVIAAMPQPLQSEIIRRIASLDEPDSQSVVAVASDLAARLPDSPRSSRPGSSQAVLAEIFGHVEPGIRRAALARLGRHDPELVRQIQGLVYRRRRPSQRLVS